MIITDKQYSMDKGMVEYFDRMADRISRPTPKLDYPLLIDGYEGYGKTNFAVGAAYYISKKTGRPFNLDNVFFDPEEMIKFATGAPNQIIVWDEMALVALAMQHGDKWQLAIIQTLMMGRKKRHLYIFCIPRFYRLKEAIIERCMGLVHVYARNNRELGRFFFHKKSALDSMYEVWKKTRRKPKYSLFQTKHGTFGESLGKILDEPAYEAKKDVAIKQILEKLKGNKISNTVQKYVEQKGKIAEYLISRGLVQDISTSLGLSRDTFYKWKKRAEIAAT